MQSDISYNYSLILGKAYRTLRVRAYETLEKYELIPTHWSLLGVVYGRQHGVTVSDMAVLLGVKLPLVTIMVDYLVEKKLIERIANKADGRSKLLIPTKTGVKQVVLIEKDMSNNMASLLVGISQPQLQTFRTVLQSIIDNDSENNQLISGKKVAHD